MISLGSAVENLLPIAKYDGYFGNVDLSPESYSDLVMKWKDTRPIPSYEDLQASIAEIQARNEARAALDAESTAEINNAPFAGRSMSEVEEWINNILTSDWPEEQVVIDLIDAQPIPSDVKTILKKHVRATYRIITIQKRTLRLLRAVLRRVAAI